MTVWQIKQICAENMNNELEGHHINQCVLIAGLEFQLIVMPSVALGKIGFHSGTPMPTTQTIGKAIKGLAVEPQNKGNDGKVEQIVSVLL